MTVVWFFAAGAAIVWIIWQRQVRRVRGLPETSDEDFENYFRTHTQLDPTEALKERVEIAKLLGVPARKLTPEALVNEIVGKDPRTRIGLGDLEFDMESLGKKAGRSGRQIPPRICDLIAVRLELKKTDGHGPNDSPGTSHRI